MGRLLVISFLLVTVLETERSQGAGYPQAANYPYLSTLCQLYLTALEPPVPKAVGMDWEEDVKLFETILAAVSDPEWFDNVEKAANPSELSDSIKKKHPNYEQEWDDWRKAQETLKTSTQFKRLNGSDPVVVSARVKLEKLRLRIGTLKGKEETFKEKKRRQGINDTMREVAYGSSKDLKQNLAEIGQQGTRKAACGTLANAAQGALAGKSLVADIMCLCAASGGTSSQQKDACGVGIGGEGSSVKWTSSSEKSQLEPIWNTIQPACNATHTPRARRVAEVRALMTQFLQQAAIGARCVRVEANENVKGGLGVWYQSGCTAGSASSGCGGDASSDGGPCVLYEKDKNVAEAVEWYKKFQTAVGTIEELENEFAQLSRDGVYIKMLTTRAEEIYEEAKKASENEKTDSPNPTTTQNQKPNPGGTTDRTTAQEPNAVSIASIPRFILQWVLLL